VEAMDLAMEGLGLEEAEIGHAREGGLEATW